MCTHVYPSNTVYLVYHYMSCVPMFTLVILYTLVYPYISCVPMFTLVILYTLLPWYILFTHVYHRNTVYLVYPYISCVPMFTLVILYTLYTGYTVLLGYTWVHRIYRGIQRYTCYAGIITYCTNISGSLFGIFLGFQGYFTQRAFHTPVKHINYHLANLLNNYN